MIVLSGGVKVFASNDSEGDAPGVRFGVDQYGAFEIGAEAIVSDA